MVIKDANRMGGALGGGAGSVPQSRIDSHQAVAEVERFNDMQQAHVQGILNGRNNETGHSI